MRMMLDRAQPHTQEETPNINLCAILGNVRSVGGQRGTLVKIISTLALIQCLAPVISTAKTLVEECADSSRELNLGTFT